MNTTRMLLIRQASAQFNERHYIELDEELLNAFKYCFSKCKHQNAFDILDGIRFYTNIILYFDTYTLEIQKRLEKISLLAFDFILHLFELPNFNDDHFHKNILEALELLVKNTHIDILKEYSNLKRRYISILWSVIRQPLDYKTQLTGLNIMLIFLKYLDPVVRNEELREHFHTLVEQRLSFAAIHCDHNKFSYEIITRNFLNYYNTLCRNPTIFSIYCLSLTLNDKYRFYKPENYEKFWVDFNYVPKTISFAGQFIAMSAALTTPSCLLLNVAIKVLYIEREDCMLYIYFEESIKTSVSNICLDDAYKMTLVLPEKEMSRILQNYNLQSHFNFKSTDLQNFRKPSSIKPLELSGVDLTQDKTLLPLNTFNETNVSTSVNDGGGDDLTMSMETPKQSKLGDVKRLRRHSIRCLRKSVKKATICDTNWQPYKYKTKKRKRKKPMQSNTDDINNKQRSKAKIRKTNSAIEEDFDCEIQTPRLQNSSTPNDSPIRQHNFENINTTNSLVNSYIPRLDQFCDISQDAAQSSDIDSIISILYERYKKALMKQWNYLRDENDCIHSKILTEIIMITESIAKEAIKLNDSEEIMFHLIDKHKDNITPAHLENYLKHTKCLESFFEKSEDIINRYQIECNMKDRHDRWLETFLKMGKTISQDILQNFLQQKQNDLINDLNTLFP